MGPKLRFVLFAALALVAAPALAQFDTGYVVSDVDLRAGPDIGYPLTDVVPAGGPVYINGCTEAFEWCDVVFQDEHGWIDGNDIQYDYDKRPLYLPHYGAAIGVPIIGFSIGTYWNRWYGNRPFYRERERWYRQPLRPMGPIHRQANDPAYSQHPQRSERPRTHNTPRLPRDATRPTAGPIRALPQGRTEAPRPSNQRGDGERHDNPGRHRDEKDH